MTSSQTAELLSGLHDWIMGSTVVKCAVTDLGIQWAGWALSAAFRTEKFYDLAGNVNSPVLHVVVVRTRFTLNRLQGGKKITLFKLKVFFLQLDIKLV